MARTGPDASRPLGDDGGRELDPDEIIVGPMDPEGTEPPDDELRALEPSNLIRSEDDNHAR